MPSKCFGDRQSLETSFYVDSWHEFMALYCATCMLVLTLLFGVYQSVFFFPNCVMGYLSCYHDECLRSNRMRQTAVAVAVALHRRSSSCKKSRATIQCFNLIFCDDSVSVFVYNQWDPHIRGVFLPFLRSLFSYDYFPPRFCRNIRRIATRIIGINQDSWLLCLPVSKRFWKLFVSRNELIKKRQRNQHVHNWMVINKGQKILHLSFLAF